MSKIPKDINYPTKIYTLSDPDTGKIRYVGKTVNQLSKRLASHVHSSKRLRTHKDNWIQSILKTGKRPLIKIVEICPWYESQWRESYWILQFITWGFRLTNLTEGGEGHLGLPMPQKVKDVLVETNSKTVHRYSMEGIYIDSFKSLKEASEFLGAGSKAKISLCARDLKKSYRGFRWSYKKQSSLGPMKPHALIGKKLKRTHRNKAVKNLIGYGKHFK